MAASSIRRSPWNNSPPTGEDELAAGAPRAPTDGSGTPSPTPAAFRASTPAPALTPGPLGMYTDVDLQKASRLALDLFVKG